MTSAFLKGAHGAHGAPVCPRTARWGGPVQTQHMANTRGRLSSRTASRSARPPTYARVAGRREIAIRATKTTVPSTGTSSVPSAPSAPSTTTRYNVVVTGGSKGAGKAIARKFLEYGDNVIICSRDESRVNATVEELLSQLPAAASNRILGIPADVSRASDMAAVASFAKDNFGTLDIWVNNAGTNAYTFKPFFEQEDDDIASVVNTNVLGVMYGTKAAINAMKMQPKGGHIFNMDGAGADGNATPRFAAYGATKRSLDQLNKSIRAELNIAKINNVGIHAISPGMVTTELLMAGGDNRFSRLMINCLAETPEDMADFLVPRIREVPEKFETSFLPSILLGQYIKFLTPIKAYSQILKRLIAGERKDRFVVEDQGEGKK